MKYKTEAMYTVLIDNKLTTGTLTKFFRATDALVATQVMCGYMASNVEGIIKQLAIIATPEKKV